MSRMGRGVEGRMNAAAGEMPKMPGRGTPAGKPGGAKANAGPERKADMAGAGVMGGGSSMGAACGELMKQHPQRHDDLGPHHGTMDHVRHAALGGMRPMKER